MLANEFCPDSTREKVVRVQTVPPYDAESHGGVIPSDYNYRVPTKTCDIHNQFNTEAGSTIDLLNPSEEENQNETDENNHNETKPTDKNNHKPPVENKENKDNKDKDSNENENPTTIDLFN